VHAVVVGVMVQVPGREREVRAVLLKSEAQVFGSSLFRTKGSGMILCRNQVCPEFVLHNLIDCTVYPSTVVLYIPVYLVFYQY
jgi:hypothetical protein